MIPETMQTFLEFDLLQSRSFVSLKAQDANQDEELVVYLFIKYPKNLKHKLMDGNKSAKTNNQWVYQLITNLNPHPIH